jgi:hypothetical protein
MINNVEGVWNVVADALSCMYAGQNDSILINDWVNADVHLDPNGETLLLSWLLESHAMHLCPHGVHSALLK